jgi:hypothetical protein
MNVFAPIAVWGFWVLLVAGWFLGELGIRGVVAFVALWVAGFVTAPLLLNGLLFLPYVAALDIALVLAIFKGDVKLN